MSNPRRSPERVVLTLEDMGADVPFAVRLKAALKRFRRSFSLKCVHVEPAQVAAVGPLTPDTEGEAIE